MTLGFLSPGILALLPVGFGLLVYIYLRHGRVKRIIVATTLFLRDLAPAPVARQRFIPPFRFFFELLLLSILACGAAGLFWKVEGSQVAILIDNSLSMGAIDRSTSPAISLLQKAKQEAISAISNLPTLASISVFATSPTLTLLNQEAATRNEAIQLIEKISLSYSPDHLQTALQKLQLHDPPSEIIVATDRRVIVKDAPNGSGGSSVIVKTIQPQAPLDNVALTNIQLNQTGREASSVVAQIANYGSSAAEFSVVILGSLENQGAPIEISKKRVKLLAGETKQIEFSGLQRRFIAFEVELDLGGISSPDSGFTRTSLARSDSIAEDNQAFIASSSATHKSILVGNSSPQDLGLNKLKLYNFEWSQSSGEKENDSLASLAQGLTIYYKPSLAKLPKRNSLIVTPLKGISNSFSVNAKKKADVTNWKRDHEVLTYLNPAVVSLPNILSITPESPYFYSLIDSSQGTLAIAGEVDGHRYVILGFEIFPYDGKASPFHSVLLLNILKWIGVGGVPTFGYSQTYDPVATEDKVFEVPGIYSTSVKNKMVAVNYFDPSESDVRANSPIIITTSSEKSAQASTTNPPLYKYLALLALILLLADLLFMMLRSLTAPLASLLLLLSFFP